MENPLLSQERPLAFASIRAEHVVPAIRQLLGEAGAQLDALSSEGKTYDSTLGALEAATERLELAMGVVEHLEAVATTDELREAYNAVLPEVTALWTSIPLRENVWQALRSFASTPEAEALDPTRKRLLDETVAEFRRHGATLDAAGKQRLSEIDRELGLITNKFSQNVLDATNAFELVLPDATKLAGLPATAIEAARENAAAKGKAGYRLSLQAPVVIAVLTYASDATLRELIWRANNGRATVGEFDNRSLIADILRLRRERANLLGFRDFADLVTEDRMAKNGAQAQAFVDELTEQTRAAFERENQELFEFRQKLEGPTAQPLRPWDISYYAEKLRRERYDLDEEELREYFPSEHALNGAFRVAELLFAVRIEPARELACWEPAVQGYRIKSSAGAELGTFYVDLYPRENKRGGAWMHGLIASVPPTPHVAVFCANVSPPVGDKPSLLVHRDVETLFHEFGHLLHHCLSRVPVRSLSCTRVAQDFVELPSQIMENWCSEREALNLFARHYKTAESIPEHLLSRLRAARTFRAGNAQMRQLGFAAVDLALHTQYDPTRDGDVMSYGRAVLARYSPSELPGDYGMLAGFSHLFASPVGYAAGYYSYKWAEVLDADAFSRFRDEGVLNPTVGAEFRDRILGAGRQPRPHGSVRQLHGPRARSRALLERQGLAA
ncbi:MAG: M3 family metallopeptidase [Polyangiaceae bacterium]